MTVLTTERLTLRNYIESDLDEHHRLMSDKENMRFLDDILTTTKEESAENLRYAMSNSDGRYFCMLLKESGKRVGSVGYTEYEDKSAVHMGYFIFPEFQGFGYAAEAVKRVLEYAFCEDGRQKVITGCHEDNTASKRVMEKAGLVFQRHKDGRFRYTLTKDEYLSRNLDNIIKKHTAMVKGIARKFAIPGIETEDLVQEGLIGLYGAVLAFSPAKGCSFHNFAKVCAVKRMNSAIKAALRGKHSPLAAYEPIMHHQKDSLLTPEELVLLKEDYALLEAAVNVRLSKFEREVLAHRLSGYKNSEIAAKLMLSRKIVDNALFRARSKLNSFRTKTR